MFKRADDCYLGIKTAVAQNPKRRDGEQCVFKCIRKADQEPQREFGVGFCHGCYFLILARGEDVRAFPAVVHPEAVQYVFSLAFFQGKVNLHGQLCHGVAVLRECDFSSQYGIPASQPGVAGEDGEKMSFTFAPLVQQCRQGGDSGYFAEIRQEKSLLGELVTEYPQQAAGASQFQNIAQAVFLAEHLATISGTGFVYQIFQQGVAHAAIHGAKMFHLGEVRTYSRQNFPVPGVGNAGDDAVPIHAAGFKMVGSFHVDGALHFFLRHESGAQGTRQVHGSTHHVAAYHGVQFILSQRGGDDDTQITRHNPSSAG